MAQTYVMAIDQGTTSSRAIIFDHGGDIIATGQAEHAQHMPQPGWVEHDATEIWDNTREVIGQALSRASLTRHDIAAVGITNQRETAVVWDRTTGKPIAPAIVWQDTRTQPFIDQLAAEINPDTGSAYGTDRFADLTGLPLATYFSASKINWILDHVAGARTQAESGQLAFGTTDSWLLWNLTGGVDGGVHATDVTNASRTMLMDLRTCQWHDQLLTAFNIPASMLPEIRSSSEVYGLVHTSQLLRETPVTGILGDQQAATFGQAAFTPGEAKNTYGTGCFVIVNTGTEIVRSRNGLLTTLAYRLGDQPPVYALEGSVAVAGSLIQWLRDNLGIIKNAAEVEKLAAGVDTNGGAYLVPAFSGLYAPYWKPDARGALVGLTRFVNRGHIARAALEATAFQTQEVLEAVDADTELIGGVKLTELRVDGGMVANELLMQFQADVLQKPVVRPKVAETTALGAAYAAGLAVGYWSGLDDLTTNWQEGKRWTPALPAEDAARRVRLWKKAVERTFDWVDEDVVAADSLDCD